jgi:DNA-binding NarL/FixJ family response regulator
MKTIAAYVGKDTIPSISWVLRDFQKIIEIKYTRSTRELIDILPTIQCSLVILDSFFNNISNVEATREIKAASKDTRILLIATDEISKETMVELIAAKVIDGIILKPFTAEILGNNIYKLCDIKKPDTPWYESKRV